MLFGLVVTPLLADTYITFRGARYYSARRNSFVEVSATGRVAFYRNRRGERPLWTHRLANIPASVLVTDDGHATVFVDAYYGNHRAPDATVLSFRDRKGRELRSYRLDALAEINELMLTTSTAYWYERAWLTDDQHFLYVVTARRKCIAPKYVNSEADLKIAHDCDTSVPSEVIRFDLDSGSIVERRPAL